MPGRKKTESEPEVSDFGEEEVTSRDSEAEVETPAPRPEPESRPRSKKATKEVNPEKVLMTARQAMEQRDYQKAQQEYERALATLQDAGAQAGVADAQFELGILAVLQGEYRIAQAYYTQALTLRQQLGHHAGEAEILHQLGILHQLLGDSLAAQQHHQAQIVLQMAGTQAGSDVYRV